MRKVSVFALIIMCVVFIMFGCRNDTHHTPPESTSSQVGFPQISEDYIALICQNTDVQIFRDASFSRSVQYQILSSTALTGERVSVRFDKNAAYSVDVTMDSQPVPIDIATAVSYQGILWEDMTPEELSVYTQELNSLQSSQMPVIYAGTLTIKFDLENLTQPIELNQLILSVKGQEVFYDIGSILLHPGGLENSNGTAILPETLCLSDVNILPSADGSFVIPSIEMSAVDNVEISRIFFSDGRSIVTQCNYSLMLADGNCINADWDGITPISASSGDKISFQITGQDKHLKEMLAGTRQWFICIEYSHNGQKYVSGCEVASRIHLPPFQYYAAYKDHIDILSYYTSYLPSLQ